MAIVSTVKDFLINTFKVNEEKIGTSNVNALLPQIENSQFIGETAQATAAQQWLNDDSNLTVYDSETIVRVLFKWFDRTEFLNSFVSETVFEGYPSNNRTIDKNSFSDDENILIEMGTTYANGNFKSESEIFSFYKKGENNGQFIRTSGGLRYKKMHYLEDFWIGSPHPIGGGFALSKTEPLFQGYFYGNDINEAFNVSSNFPANHLNLYQGMNTENVSEVDEVNFYIVDDADPYTYHMFRLYNKKQLFNLFLLFDFDFYYKTIEDLQQGQNQFDFNDIDVQPGELPPGQESNQIDNVFGNGNFTSDVIDYPVNAILGSGVGMSTYILTGEQLKHVLSKVWDPSLIEILTNFDLSPIVNALIWPCDMTSTREGSTVTSAGVYIGKTPIPFNTIDPSLCQLITNKYLMIKDFGVMRIDEKEFFGSFMDFEPYTNAYIYLPYYGTVPIPMCDIIGHNVSVKLCLDASTGAGKYLIMIDSIAKYNFDAQVGIQIQLTNSNFSETLQGLMRNSVSQIMQSPKAAGSIVSDGVGNALGSMNSFDISTVGSSGNNNERLNSQEVYFVFERVETAIPEGFNKNFGRPSMITTQLSELKGFTTVLNPIIETTATDPEKEQIKSILQEGVFIL